MAANESISEAYIVVSNCNKTGVYYSYIFELGTHCDNACEHVWVRFSSSWFDERDVDVHHRDPRCRTFRGTPAITAPILWLTPLSLSKSNKGIVVAIVLLAIFIVC